MRRAPASLPSTVAVAPAGRSNSIDAGPAKTVIGAMMGIGGPGGFPPKPKPPRPPRPWAFGAPVGVAAGRLAPAPSAAEGVAGAAAGAAGGDVGAAAGCAYPANGDKAVARVASRG